MNSETSLESQPCAFDLVVFKETMETSKIPYYLEEKIISAPYTPPKKFADVTRNQAHYFFPWSSFKYENK